MAKRVAGNRSLTVAAPISGMPRSTPMSHLTGQCPDHETPSCELPGAKAPVRLTTNCWKAKTFSFSFDFLQNQVTLDCDSSAASHKNEETLAGQVAHPTAMLCRGRWENSAFARFEGRRKIQFSGRPIQISERVSRNEKMRRPGTAAILPFSSAL